MKPRPPANGAPPGGVWQLTQLPASARYLPRAIKASAGLGGAAGLAVAAGAPLGAPLADGAGVPGGLDESAAAASCTLPRHPAIRSPASSDEKGNRFTRTLLMITMRQKRAILHTGESPGRVAAVSIYSRQGSARSVCGSLYGLSKPMRREPTEPRSPRPSALPCLLRGP